ARAQGLALAQHFTHIGGFDVLVNAVAAQNQRLAAAQLHMFHIGNAHGTVAHHARGIVRRTSAGGGLAQVPVRVVAGQKLWPGLGCWAEAIDAAVADPRDQPFGEKFAGGCAQRDRCGTGPGAAMREAATDIAIGFEQRVSDRRRIDTAAIERPMQPQDELTARPRRERSSTDAVGNDEHRRTACDGTMAVFIDRMRVTAERSRGERELRPWNRELRLLRHRTALLLHLAILRRQCGFARCYNAHQPILWPSAIMTGAKA